MVQTLFLSMLYRPDQPTRRSLSVAPSSCRMVTLGLVLTVYPDARGYNRPPSPHSVAGHVSEGAGAVGRVQTTPVATQHVLEFIIL
jgi:hypothetical protein